MRQELEPGTLDKHTSLKSAKPAQPAVSGTRRTEEYLHRVGRTARIGKSGSALLFLQPSEQGFLEVLRGRGLTDLREMSLEERRKTKMHELLDKGL